MKEQLADKDQQIAALRLQCTEATTGWREQTDATRQVTAVLDKINAILVERRGAA